ncbi:MAG: metalloregulator ArsR/SmtB family transcription factor [Verrucomicrobia bacterium]|nr:metalloregulator ArsR/SmtB family transcription factor [Verrucomicrobiota bacterium]
MVNNEEQLNRVFHALADPTRRRILAKIASSDATVGELAEPFSISAPAVSKHLKTLEGALLINRVKKGKIHRFQLNTQPLQNAQVTINQLTTFWLQRLTNLENLLNSNQK